MLYLDELYHFHIKPVLHLHNIFYFVNCTRFIFRNNEASRQEENREHTQSIKNQQFMVKIHFTELKHSVCFLFCSTENLLAKTQVT